MRVEANLSAAEVATTEATLKFELAGKPWRQWWKVKQKILGTRKKPQFRKFIPRTAGQFSGPKTEGPRANENPRDLHTEPNEKIRKVSKDNNNGGKIRFATKVEDIHHRIGSEPSIEEDILELDAFSHVEKTGVAQTRRRGHFEEGDGVSGELQASERNSTETEPPSAIKHDRGNKGRTLAQLSNSVHDAMLSPRGLPQKHWKSGDYNEHDQNQLVGPQNGVVGKKDLSAPRPPQITLSDIRRAIHMNPMTLMNSMKTFHFKLGLKPHSLRRGGIQHYIQIAKNKFVP